MFLIWNLGLGKREDYENRDEDEDEKLRRALRPREFRILEDDSPLSIIKIESGGLHTVALANNGQVFSWGCNDDGVLGRTGTECIPMRVTLPEPVTDISVGDNHTIAYSTSENKVYYWGCYRTNSGTKLNKSL